MASDIALNTALATKKKAVPSSLHTTTSTPSTVLHQQDSSKISALQNNVSDLEPNISSEPNTDNTDARPPLTRPPRPPTSHKASTAYSSSTPKVLNALRVEVRWASKDFLSLKASKALMYTRFAPISSGSIIPASSNGKLTRCL